MKIKILGTGCAKCKKLSENAEKAAIELGLDYSLEKVTDISDIMAFNVMMTPALVIDDEVKLSGTVSTTKEIKKILEN